MALSMSEELDNFVSSYVENANECGLAVPFDKDWPSSCYQSEASQKMVKILRTLFVT